jgi:hypothetical protein
VVENPVANRLGEVEPPPVALQHVHQPQRLAVVAKAPPRMLAKRRVKRLLADVPERRMAQIMTQADGLGEVLVQPERPSHRPRDPARLDRVG